MRLRRTRENLDKTTLLGSYCFSMLQTLSQPEQQHFLQDRASFSGFIWCEYSSHSISCLESALESHVFGKALRAVGHKWSLMSACIHVVGNRYKPDVEYAPCQKHTASEPRKPDRRINTYRDGALSLLLLFPEFIEYKTCAAIELFCFFKVHHKVSRIRPCCLLLFLTYGGLAYMQLAEINNQSKKCTEHESALFGWKSFRHYFQAYSMAQLQAHYVPFRLLKTHFSITRAICQGVCIM